MNMKDPTPTLHLVTHTHWDREWYQTFQQFRLKLVRMVDHVLALLECDPNFRHFMLDGQTIVLEDYLEMRPEQEARLKELVKAGKILIGPWYILPDEFLVSPEAIIRNLIEGDRVARRFGPKMKVGYVPDPFGHIGQLPQILQGFGIDTACVQRGLDDEPVEFNWQAPDGTSVLMAYLRDGYGNAAGLPAGDPALYLAEVSRLRDSLAGHSAVPSGHVLLMHGTDHTEPPFETSAMVTGFNQSEERGCLVHSTLPEYLQEMRRAVGDITLPTVKGELRSPKRSPLLPGVLSARAWIKQRNFTCQNLLEKYAEPLSAWAARLIAGGIVRDGNQPKPVIHNPQPVLRTAWRLLLQNHPHDSICGCSIDQVHEEMRPRFDQAEQIGAELVNQGLAVLGGAVDTRFTGAPDRQPASAILVYNPCAHAASAPVEINLEIPAGADSLEVIDESGRAAPLQAEGLHSTELINIVLSAKALQEAFGMLGAGQINGMVVSGIHLEREGETARIDLQLGGGEPNLDEWNRTVEAVQALFAEGAVKSYHVQARSAPAARALLLAEEVPACGYRTYWVCGSATAQEGKQPSQPGWLARAAIPAAARLTRVITSMRNQFAPQSNTPAVRRKPSTPPYRIENEFFIVEAAPNDGTLTVTDRRSGTVYPGLNRFVDGGDCGDEYNYCPPASDEVIIANSIRGVYGSTGEVQSQMEIELGLALPAGLNPDRKSRSSRRVEMHLTTIVTLTQGVPRVDVQTRVDNRHIQDHRLRVHFPAPFQVEAAEMDGHFESVRRPIALPAFDESWIENPRPEKPQRLFTRIEAGGLGMLIANRGLPEIEALNRAGHTELALTLLRCVGWLSRDDFSTRRGHAGPFMATPGAQNPGPHTFEYAIIPYAAATAQEAVRQAEAFEAPLKAAPTTIHAGALPARGSLVTVEPEGFALSAVKPAEDGDGIIVRGWNRTDHSLQVRLKPLLEFQQAHRTNMLEETQEGLELREGQVEFPAGPHQVVTVRLS